MKTSSSLVFGIGLVVAGSLLASGVALAADAPFSGQAAAGQQSKKPLELEADGVAFGMSSDQVARLYDRWWDRHFVAKYRKANPGPKTRELDYQLEEQKKVLRRVWSFDGRSATHDKAEFREEFAHNNHESMSSTKVLRRGSGPEGKAVSYTRRFFFFQDKLWKVYDEYRLESQGPLGADFKEAAERVVASLGPSAKRTRGATSQQETVTLDAGSSRVRVVKLAADRVAVVRADAALAKAVLDSRVKNAPRPEPALDEDTQAALR